MFNISVNFKSLDNRHFLQQEVGFPKLIFLMVFTNGININMWAIRSSHEILIFCPDWAWEVLNCVNLISISSITFSHSQCVSFCYCALFSLMLWVCYSKEYYFFIWFNIIFDCYYTYLIYFGASKTKNMFFFCFINVWYFILSFWNLYFTVSLAKTGRFLPNIWHMHFHIWTKL